VASVGLSRVPELICYMAMRSDGEKVNGLSNLSFPRIDHQEAFNL
jgi:hypothetical protein